MKLKTIFATIASQTLLILTASACDFCACDLPDMGLGGHVGWSARVSEQFTHFGTLQQDGQTIANPNSEHLDSSITQLIIGYDFAKTLGVQLSVPLVSRSFRRWRDGALESGTVGGIGDVTLLAHWTPLTIQRSDFLVAARIHAGLSLPTGDSSRVLEEAAESGEGEGEGETVASGIHGHDLALGSGGVGGIFGGDVRVQWKRIFVTAGIEGTVRGGGENDYDFADEMSWHTSLGAFLVDGEEFNLALALDCAGSSKGEDTFRGVRATDTASSIVWLGPQLSANWAKRYHAEFGVDFPVARSNSGVQSVPDWRVTAGFGVRF